jgi:hypothetical protein
VPLKIQVLMPSFLEHFMSHPCLFCLNKASCSFLNHNIQNSTAASARSHNQKACDAFSQPLSHHKSTLANGNLHPMFKTQQAQRKKNEKNSIAQRQTNYVKHSNRFQFLAKTLPEVQQPGPTIARQGKLLRRTRGFATGICSSYRLPGFPGRSLKVEIRRTTQL